MSRRIFQVRPGPPKFNRPEYTSTRTNCGRPAYLSFVFVGLTPLRALAPLLPLRTTCLQLFLNGTAPPWTSRAVWLLSQNSASEFCLPIQDSELWQFG